MATSKGSGGKPEAEKDDVLKQDDPGEESARLERERADRVAKQAVEQRRAADERPAPDPRDVRQEPDSSATMNRAVPDASPDAERERAAREPAVPGQPAGAVYPDRGV